MDIAWIWKYSLCYGCKGVATPTIQIQIWKEAALGCDERREAEALCAGILSTTVARRAIAMAECIVGRGSPPLGRSVVIRKVSIGGFTGGQSYWRNGTPDYSDIKVSRASYCRRALSLYEFVSRVGDFPVSAGDSIRRQWPPSEAYALAILLARKPWRGSSVLRGESVGNWAPECYLFLELDTCPLTLKVSLVRERASTRARARVQEDPTQD